MKKYSSIENVLMYNKMFVIYDAKMSKQNIIPLVKIWD